MSVIDAAYHTGHDYPGGIPALAVRMGMNAGTLQNKLNPRQAHAHLLLQESVKLQQLADDHRILYAMAAELGETCIRVGHFEGISDLALLETYTQLMSKLGAFSQAFHDALADGRITRKEFEQFRQLIYDTERAGRELLNRAEQLVQEPPESRGE